MGEIIANRFSSDTSKGFDSGNSSGGGGDMTDLIRRVANLEADVKTIQVNVSQIQRDVAVSEKPLDHIVSIMATKSDISDIKASMANLETALHKELNAQTWKIFAWIVGVIGLVFAIARYIKP